MSRRKANPHIGGSVDDWLREEGIYEEVTARAIKKVLAWQVEQAMEPSQAPSMSTSWRWAISSTDRPSGASTSLG